MEKVLFEENPEEGITNEPLHSNSFNKATRRLFSCTPAILFGNICDFKDSTWSPDQNIDDLLQVLRRHGPMVIGGHFGKNCYEERPIEVDKNQLNKVMQGWPRNTKRMQTPQLRFVIVVGFVKVESPTNAGG